MALPEWTNSVFPDKMLPLAERNLALLTENSYMKRMKAGPLLTEILRQMGIKRAGNLLENESPTGAMLDDLLNLKYDSKMTDRSIVIYSGHDVTLVSLMRALGVIDETSRKPDYGAAFGIELHQGYNDDDDFEVKVSLAYICKTIVTKFIVLLSQISQQLVYYFNSEDKAPTVLTIPNCNSPCTFARFAESVKDLMVLDFAEACKLS